MDRTLRIGRILGIEIRLDYSWFIAFALVAWSLVRHYFPATHPGWSMGVYWAMGAVTALLFFGSVLAHEMAHSLVSQAHGVPVRDITLYIFGGGAQIEEEPRSARGQLLMALAGPFASLGLAGLFGLLWLAILPASPQLHALAGWLAWINAGVGLFNLIPGFPLDGGRVLRAAIWGITGDLRRATQIAARVGQVVAAGLILWGIWHIFRGNWANGAWIAFIGWFLDDAARASQRQVTLQDMLAGHAAREVMMTDCPRIARDLPLDVVVERVALPSGRRCFPVMEDDRVLGLLTLHDIKKVPRERWATTRVEEVMIPLHELKMVAPGDDLAFVFERMAAEDVNQFPVMEDGTLLGMVARNNVLAFLRTRTELGY
jgi:Zn-dependent protease/predicted transcriptional regulator